VDSFALTLSYKYYIPELFFVLEFKFYQIQLGDHIIFIFVSILLFNKFGIVTEYVFSENWVIVRLIFSRHAFCFVE